MVSLTGGPRAFARAGFRLEEETNWRRAELVVATGLGRNRHTVYRLGPPSPVTSRQFNRAVLRLRTNRAVRRAFLAGDEITGKLEMPLLTLHTTGDGQVPIEQARILRRRVDAAGRHRLLVQRVIRDAGHCGFTSTEWEASLEALVRWVGRGRAAEGERRAGSASERSPAEVRAEPTSGHTGGRGGSGGPAPGEAARQAHAGRCTVRRPVSGSGGAEKGRTDHALPVGRCRRSAAGVTRITVMAGAEASGCGVPGARIALWTFVGDRFLYSREARRWPRAGSRRVDASFSSATPEGAVAPRAQFGGEVFRPDGHQLPAGTRIEAYIGTTRCGVTSVRRTGSFSGFSLDVVGPDSIPGCARGATITFRVNGRPAPDTAVNQPGQSGPTGPDGAPLISVRRPPSTPPERRVRHPGGTAPDPPRSRPASPAPPRPTAP